MEIRIFKKQSLPPSQLFFHAFFLSRIKSISTVFLVHALLKHCRINTHRGERAVGKQKAKMMDGRKRKNMKVFPPFFHFSFVRLFFFSRLRFTVHSVITNVPIVNLKTCEVKLKG